MVFKAPLLLEAVLVQSGLDLVKLVEIRKNHFDVKFSFANCAGLITVQVDVEYVQDFVFCAAI